MEENVDYTGRVSPCTPKINIAESELAVIIAERIFRACCPPNLTVSAVDPKTGRGKVFKCWWKVTYVNREEPQPLTDRQMAECFQNSTPRGTRIISINKTVIPLNWTVMYRRNVCRCGDGFSSHKFSNVTACNNLISTSKFNHHSDDGIIDTKTYVSVFQKCVFGVGVFQYIF